MKRLFMLAGIMAALVFSSCKKDKDSDNNNGGGGTTKLLKKVTRTENGTTTVFNLNYDGNKRLTSFNSTDNLETTNFSYDGAGNVTKVEVRQHNYYSIYTYNYSNGIPVSATIKTTLKVAGEPDDPQQDDELTYTVSNNQITKIHQKAKLEDNYEMDINLTYHSNGNLAKAEAAGDLAFAFNYTYGSKKPAFPTLSKWVLDLGFSLEFAAKNELITTFMDFPGTIGDMTITNQYTYDAGGYPLTSDDGETQLKFEYQ
jgi:YD repeat-containing protein